MYCGQCGKEIKDNSKFCPYCGDKNMVQGNVSSRKEINLPDKNGYVNPIFSIIPLILASILLFRYYGVAFSRIDANKDAFYWVSDSAEMAGIILHWLVPITPTISYVEYLVKCIKSKMNVKFYNCTSLGMSMFIWGGMLWIGRMIYEDWSSNNDMSIVLYRIFSTYRELISITMLFAVIVFVCGALIGKKAV